MHVHVSPEIMQELVRHSRTTHPNECCGILYGTPDRITAAEPAANVHATPRTHFEIDPAALIAAHRTARDGGVPIAGYYHSHPTGIAEPSATDAAMAAGDGRIWAIIAQDNIRFWRDTGSGFVPLSYALADS
ncbi:MAG: M67 family metallopeptidase [Pontixanthobacter sp.]